ncbi:Mob1/phocein [Neoconidiobolus thromboides FSU 785]|nr:Mob1/phocein [Neoconidiobolus thromboides FSU 785]
MAHKSKEDLKKEGASNKENNNKKVSKSKSKISLKSEEVKSKKNEIEDKSEKNNEGKTNNQNDQLNFRRIMIGDKLEDSYNWSKIDFETLESPCSLQEYLQDLIRRDPLNIEILLNIPDSQSPDIWLYEHLRFFYFLFFYKIMFLHCRQVCLELSYMVVQLQNECNSKTCPEMKASEFFFLCACHPSPQGCCAIDYIVHTLDGAISLLNNPKYFPSSSIKHFLSISRRLYRIFAHAYFHHKEVFEIFENQHRLYRRFLKLSEQYSLIPPPLINIPDLDKEDKPKKVEEKISLNINLNPNLVFAEEESDEEEGASQASKFEPLSRSDTVLRRE